MAKHLVLICTWLGDRTQIKHLYRNKTNGEKRKAELFQVPMSQFPESAGDPAFCLLVNLGLNQNRWILTVQCWTRVGGEAMLGDHRLSSWQPGLPTVHYTRWTRWWTTFTWESAISHLLSLYLSCKGFLTFFCPWLSKQLPPLCVYTAVPFVLTHLSYPATQRNIFETV